jgi:hypothetical protein
VPLYYPYYFYVKIIGKFYPKLQFPPPNMIGKLSPKCHPELGVSSPSVIKYITFGSYCVSASY